MVGRLSLTQKVIVRFYNPQPNCLGTQAVEGRELQIRRTSVRI